MSDPSYLTISDHHIHYYDLRNTSSPLHVFRGHRKAVSYVRFINKNEMLSASTDCSLRLWDVEKIRNYSPFSGLKNGLNFAGDSSNVSSLSLGGVPMSRSTRAGGNIPLQRYGPSPSSSITAVVSAAAAAAANRGMSQSTSTDNNMALLDGNNIFDPSLIRSFQGHLNEKNFVGMSVNCDGEFLACGSETNSVYVYYNKLPKPIMSYPFGNPIDIVTVSRANGGGGSICVNV